MSPRPPSQHVLLAALRNGTVDPRWSNDRIGEKLGFCGRTISKYIALLEEDGQLDVKRRPPNKGGPGSDPTGRTLVPVE